jgi:two-component system response regulator NreC
MRAIVVDDYPPFLTALIALLSGKSGIEVVGQAHNGEDALKLAAAVRPELVLVDFTMPGMNGIEVARKLKSVPIEPKPKVIVMSFHAEPEYKDMALQAGADGYLVKTEIHQELLPLLRRIMG